jgi:3-methyl-2-oxobutanoate hydroxymethyltransferase
MDQPLTDCLWLQGGGCSGQVQVLHDVLGLYDKLHPKFSRQYVDCGSVIQNAVESYVFW